MTIGQNRIFKHRGLVARWMFLLGAGSDVVAAVVAGMAPIHADATQPLIITSIVLHRVFKALGAKAICDPSQVLSIVFHITSMVILIFTRGLWVVAEEASGEVASGAWDRYLSDECGRALLSCALDRWISTFALRSESGKAG